MSESTTEPREYAVIAEAIREIGKDIVEALRGIESKLDTQIKILESEDL